MINNHTCLAKELVAFIAFFNGDNAGYFELFALIAFMIEKMDLIVGRALRDVITVFVITKLTRHLPNYCGYGDISSFCKKMNTRNDHSLFGTQV